MNREPIVSKNARFETVSVTIQTVRVGAKQMTIAVFRQLPILDARYFDVAQKWGFVRYNVDGADVWFVLAFEEKLYRFPHCAHDELSGIRKAQALVRERLEMVKTAREVFRSASGIEYTDETARAWLQDAANGRRGDVQKIIEAIDLCRKLDPQRLVEALRDFEAEAQRIELIDTCPQLFIAV